MPYRQDENGNVVWDDYPDPDTSPAPPPDAAPPPNPTPVNLPDPNMTPDVISQGGMFDESRVPADVPIDWARNFIASNPGDYGRLAAAYASEQGTGTARGSQAGADWFAKNKPLLSNYGAPAAPFGETYTAETYTPPDWTEMFKPPTQADVEADPGYRTRLDATQRGFEHSAASRGSVLSGGFVGRTLPRALGEQASNEYASTFQRAYDTYRQRYGEFSDTATRGANAFNTNEAGRYNQYLSRFNAYDANVKNTQTAERDRWTREMDLSRLGLDSFIAGRPAS